jgi:hypothetical protein
MNRGTGKARPAIRPEQRLFTSTTPKAPFTEMHALLREASSR